jgi:hypothetical protein
LSVTVLRDFLISVDFALAICPNLREVGCCGRPRGVRSHKNMMLRNAFLQHAMNDIAS